MFPISRKNKIILNYILVLILVFFSFAVNWNYAKYGIFPIDTFLHYDSSYRILEGEYPVKDYWIVSGFLVDFIQAFFFKIGEVNWQAYIFHSSLFNVAISLFTFFLLIELNLNKFYAFFYAFSIAILAYPVSGTPFVDMHSTYFCLLATYLIFLATKKPKKNYIWALTVLFFALAFLSKQVPTVYLIILYSPIILIHLVITKNFQAIKVIAATLLLVILSFYLILELLKIDYKLFLLQYIYFPQSIGSDRLVNFQFTIEDFFNHYKFILIPLFLLIFIGLKTFSKNKINFYSKDFINILILFSLCSGLIVHQVLTKNQIYIYFLIPLCFGFLQIQIEKSKINFKKFLKYLILFVVIFTTTKYHLRFNEDRKFHELANVDLSKAIESKELDKSLEGIQWISPYFPNNPQNEIIFLKEIKSEIDNINNKIMVFTHYSFLDSVTSNNLNSPSRTHTVDGASMPMKDNKYFRDYKKYIEDIIVEKNIKQIYFLKFEKLSTKAISQYIKKDCYTQSQDKLFIQFKIEKNCYN